MGKATDKLKVKPTGNKQPLLVVADPGLADACISALRNENYEFYQAHNVREALKFLNERAQAGDKSTMLLAQENLTLGTKGGATPEALADVRTFDMGAALIKYAKDEKLISFQTKACLMTMDNEKYGELPPPEDITRVIYLANPNINLVRELDPVKRHRPRPEGNDTQPQR